LRLHFIKLLLRNLPLNSTYGKIFTGYTMSVAVWPYGCLCPAASFHQFRNKADWQLNVAVPALGATVPTSNYMISESLVPIFDLLPETSKQAFSTEDNRWVINDQYTGGPIQPLEVKIPNPSDPTQETPVKQEFTNVPSTPAQPGSFSLPNKNYLHPVSYYASTVSVPPVLSAHYLHDLAYKRKHFAMMKSNFSTLNFTNVKVSFWRVGGEGQSVYFSTDGGTTWTLLANITGVEKNWKNEIVSHPGPGQQGDYQTWYTLGRCTGYRRCYGDR
jgi:hypothetical protein